MIRLGRSERMSGLLRLSWTKSGEELEEQVVGCIDTEPEQVDELTGDVNVRIADNDTRNDEGMEMIKDILEIMRSGQVWNCAGLTGKCWQNGRIM